VQACHSRLRRPHHSVPDKQGVRRALAPVAQFDLVSMDLQTPRLDGLAATKLIRTQRSAEALPIVGLSAHARTSGAGCRCGDERVFDKSSDA